MPAFERELLEAVRDAYRVFPPLPRIGPWLRVCPCCVSDEAVGELVRTPRECLTGEALAAYLGSAHDCDEIALREFRHFLPRVLELIAQDREIGPVSLECALQRLGPGPEDWPQADYRLRWSAREIAALDAFFRAYWLKTLHAPTSILRHSETGEWLFDGHRAEEALCMIARAGGDLDEMLALWDACDAPSADYHLASLVASATVHAWTAVARSLDKGARGDAHWDCAPDCERRVVRFLLRPAICARLTDAFTEAPENSPQAQALAAAHDEVERALLLAAPRAFRA